jgi:hypothetical protein
MKQSRIYHQNAVHFLRRRNRPKEVSRKAPLPKVKAGWQMPKHLEAHCLCCKERIRPMAYNDSGEIHLSIGCRCDALIEEIPWPFVDEFIHRSREALEKLGFEYHWG